MKAKHLAQAAVTAALYIVLTLAVAPISSGIVQFRVSEALCVLPYFIPAAVPGLFIGCFVANLLTGALLVDVIFGSLTTLVAAFFTYAMAQKLRPTPAKWLAPLPAVVLNALVIGYLWAYVYGDGAQLGFLLCAMYIGLGQLGACYGVGMPLLFLLERYGKRLFY